MEITKKNIMIMCLRISYVNLRIGLHIHPIIYYLWMFEVKYWNSFFVSSYMFLLVFLHILKKWMMSLMCLFCMQIFLKYTLYTYVCKFNFMRRRSVVPFVQPCWPLRWDCWKVHVLGPWWLEWCVLLLDDMHLMIDC
jgi:hypothetical protein